MLQITQIISSSNTANNVGAEDSESFDNQFSDFLEQAANNNDADEKVTNGKALDSQNEAIVPDEMVIDESQYKYQLPDDFNKKAPPTFVQKEQPVTKSSKFDTNDEHKIGDKHLRSITETENQPEDNDDILPIGKKNTDPLLTSKYNAEALVTGKNNAEALVAGKYNADASVAGKNNADAVVVSKNNTNILLASENSVDAFQTAKNNTVPLPTAKNSADVIEPSKSSTADLPIQKDSAFYLKLDKELNPHQMLTESVDKLSTKQVISADNPVVTKAIQADQKVQLQPSDVNKSSTDLLSQLKQSVDAELAVVKNNVTDSEQKTALPNASTAIKDVKVIKPVEVVPQIVDSDFTELEKQLKSLPLKEQQAVIAILTPIAQGQLKHSTVSQAKAQKLIESLDPDLQPSITIKPIKGGDSEVKSAFVQPQSKVSDVRPQVIDKDIVSAAKHTSDRSVENQTTIVQPVAAGVINSEITTQQKTQQNSAMSAASPTIKTDESKVESADSEHDIDMVIDEISPNKEIKLPSSLMQQPIKLSPMLYQWASQLQAQPSGDTQFDGMVNELMATGQIRSQNQPSHTINQLIQQPIDITRSDAAKQIADKATMLLNIGRQEAEIRLDPPELGSMQIRVRSDAEQAQINFVVQNQQAKEVLEQSMEKLKEMLAEHGLSLGESHVEQQDGGDAQQQQAQSGSSNSQINEEEETIAQKSSTQRGEIDFYA